MSNELMATMANKFGISKDEMLESLVQTAFKQQGSNAITLGQMNALMVVANEYNLNPWTKEIYAFPSNGGIVPIVGIDGWSRIINENPNFDGMDFEQDEESCTCIIYRKDRNHPIKVTEYMSECSRNTGPWKSHPKRMLRHKALIQCARIAFSYTGIFDEDEAERIVEGEKDVTPKEPDLPKEPEFYPQEDFDKNIDKWVELIRDKGKKAEALINQVQTKGLLTEDQKQKLYDAEPRVIEGEIMEDGE